MKQEMIKIGDISVPIMVEDGIKYYPITYLSEKVLLRKGNKIIHSKNRNDYKNNLKQFSLDFGDNNIQKSNCITERGLKTLLSKTQQGRLSTDQRSSQNHLHKYLGIKLLSERELIKNKLTECELSEHDNYTKEVISSTIENEKNLKFLMCSKCEKYYPMLGKFFMKDNRNPNGFGKVCRVCKGTIEKFTHTDKNINKLKTGGLDLFEAYKEGSIWTIYKSYLDGRIKFLPDCYKNKDGYIEIIEHLYNNELVNKKEINIKTLTNKFKLDGLRTMFNINEIHEIIFGTDVKYYPWKYPNYQMPKICDDLEYVKSVFDNYNDKNGIEINDPLKYDYTNNLHNARVRIKDILGFAVYYNNYKYPGYKFKTRGVNYYKEEANLLFDLKFLIENDLKISNGRVPLYLTKNVLQQKCTQLYRWIVTKENGSIYEWVNKLYPNEYIEADFTVNPHRNEFDSDTECFIHEMLNEQFDNVLYNQKHGKNTITLSGMIPDWFIFTDSGVWIIEYFGMYVERQKNSNERIKDYIDKTHRKINDYEKMEGYNFIYLYPDDIVDDFKGYREKLSVIQ